MKKLVALAVGVALAIASLTHAGPNVVTQADSVYAQTRSSNGVALFDSLIADTIAVGMADSSRILDLRGYDVVEVEMFVWGVDDTCSNVWTRLGVRWENYLVGNLRSRTIPDSIATSINIDEPKYDLSGRGSLAGDSLTYTNVPIGSGNMVQSRARPGETQVIVGMPDEWNNANFAQKSNGVSFALKREGGKPLRFGRLHVRTMAQSCYSATKVPRVLVRMYAYRKSDRTTK